jgi:hypothetical protein
MDDRGPFLLEFFPMAEPLRIPETRFITDAEREELRAL